MDWTRLAKAVKQRFVPGTRKLPAPVYGDLVVTWKQPHETAEHLRCVCKKAEVEGQSVTLIRIVDPDELRQRGLDVQAYADLDGHASVIWYEGWFRFVPDIKVALTPVNAPRGRRR